LAAVCVIVYVRLNEKRTRLLSQTYPSCCGTIAVITRQRRHKEQLYMTVRRLFAHKLNYALVFLFITLLAYSSIGFCVVTP